MDLKKTLLITPTRLELYALSSVVEFSKVVERNRLPHIVSGIGPGATAMTLTMIMERQRPEIVILVGIGGCYKDTGVGLEDVCLAESEIYGDLGRCTPKGVEPIEIGNERIPMMFPLKDRWTRFLKPDFFKILDGIGIKAIPMVTVSCASADFERAARLKHRFKAAVENMEGAAAAQVCSLYYAPLIELRGISNYAGDPDKARWTTEGALKKTATVLVSILNYLKILSPGD
ncbi:MAG: futalosine hydrolase [Dissulfurimicrobium sp.]|uniref:futalosine hydrolase n=1 Tax=Dissulfurimicrobium TaxID=1769732 RepID=UPI001EDC90DF|nr:futalosine hydrolase [Dissulfurimicrobium hydrothermale]UKL14362.1 futalosine hydrolase [Dissulfurimicrobium hydrothermale]